MFNVGDIVIHPGCGISKVEAIENDAEGRIYILKPKKSAPGNFRILIPEKTIKKSGVHYPIKKDKIPEILKVLEKKPNDLSEDHKAGYKSTKEKLQSGCLYKTAEVLRDLKNESGNAYSSTRESLLESARKVPIEEIAYVSGISKDEVENWIDRALKKKI